MEVEVGRHMENPLSKTRSCPQRLPSPIDGKSSASLYTGAESWGQFWVKYKRIQIAEERREMKGKIERERYIQLNAEFQRIARREEKSFLNEQFKQLEENNRMKKGKGLANKIRDIKGIFHSRMGRIKDRNSKDLIEAEEIKKRWQKCTELYKKDLNDPDNHDGVVTHPEPDILHCEISCPEEALLWTKLVEAMEFQLSCLKS